MSGNTLGECKRIRLTKENEESPAILTQYNQNENKTLTRVQRYDNLVEFEKNPGLKPAPTGVSK